jgi:ankyrin repeat protein
VFLATVLVEYGADVNALDEDFMSPMDIAMNAGHEACVRYIRAQGGLPGRQEF